MPSSDPAVSIRQFIRMDALSPISYQYRRAFALDDIENPFAEPTRYPSNVEGGLGVFAGMTRNAVRLPDR